MFWEKQGSRWENTLAGLTGFYWEAYINFYTETAGLQWLFWKYRHQVLLRLEWFMKFEKGEHVSVNARHLFNFDWLLAWRSTECASQGEFYETRLRKDCNYIKVLGWLLSSIWLDSKRLYIYTTSVYQVISRVILKRVAYTLTSSIAMIIFCLLAAGHR